MRKAEKSRLASEDKRKCRLCRFSKLNERMQKIRSKSEPTRFSKSIQNLEGKRFREPAISLQKKEPLISSDLELEWSLCRMKPRKDPSSFSIIFSLNFLIMLLTDMLVCCMIFGHAWHAVRRLSLPPMKDRRGFWNSKFLSVKANLIQSANPEI